MKKFAILLMTVLSVLVCAQMLQASGEGVWTRKADFGGGGIKNASGFAIGNKGYIGTGRDSSGNSHAGFWEYDPSGNAWTQKADFGGVGRAWAVGFAIGNKGYIGTGLRDDFWEYNPSANTWTQKADFGGGGTRDGAVGFSIGSKGYVGTGGYGPQRDFWEYDPSTNVWTRKADFPGGGRSYSVGFSIGSRGYMGTGMAGYGNNTWRTGDFWEYDPSADTWTRKADFGGSVRYMATGFSIGGKGYIGTGYNSEGAHTMDFWEYDPSGNVWTRKADYGGGGRNGAVGFSIGNKGYIGTGGSSDFWEYTPAGITTGSIPGKVFLPGSSGTVPYDSVTLSFNSGNVFTAYLSNASGSFANEVAIGTLTGTDPSGTILVAFPATTSHGTGYRVRVKSSNPAYAGDDNGSDIATLSILINSGNTYTNTSSVSLALSCPYTVDCSSMRFRNESLPWSEVSYSPSHAWTLSTGDGLKTVSVKFQRNGGTLSNAYSETITLDTVPPVLLVSGSPSSPTTSTSNTFTVSGTDVVAYRYKLDDNAYSADTPVATPLTLANLSEGTHSLSVIARDAAGNESASFAHTWIVDTDYAMGAWVPKADFKGIYRYGAVSFSIGSKGYIGTGDGSAYFWEYDLSTNTWTQKADFGGGGRTYATGFSIGGKGYIGAGTGYADFWEYDPSGNAWTRKADLGGGGRDLATGFSIGGKGYMGLGRHGSGEGASAANDFWEYDPSADTWTRKADFGGGLCWGVVGFSAGAKGYIGTGWCGGDWAVKDFWEYDPSADTWTRKADFGGDPRYGTMAFSIGAKGYMGTDRGYANFWEYDPSADTWTRKADFGGGGGYEAVGFAIAGKGYISVGSNFWEYNHAGITTGSMPGNVFLPGSSGTVPYDSVTLSFNSGNVFTAYLSDGSGNFANEIAIGTLTNTDTSGTIPVAFPATTSPGTGYRVRVKSSDPAYVGKDNGSDTMAVYILINSGNPYTNTPAVSLALSCPYCTSMQVRNESLPWSEVSYNPSNPSYAWTLSAEDGLKTVSVRFTYGETWSDIYSADIRLDTAAPAAALSSPPSSRDTVTSPAFTVTGAGVVAYRYSLDGSPYSEETSVVSPILLTNLADGSHTISIIGKDGAGNWQDQASAAAYAWIVDGDYNKGVWTRRADFGGGGRSCAVGFAIGAKGYMGTGNIHVVLPDFWEYDPSTDTWTPKALFGGGGRTMAAGFAIGNKGYIGMGMYGWKEVSSTPNDFWEYDPSTDTWTQKADFGGEGRIYLAGFAIGTKGYMGMGISNYVGSGSPQVASDFWEYDPIANTWTRKADFGGEARFGAVGFSIASKGYIGTGSGYSGSGYADFWEYDPSADTWTRKADFGGEARYGAVGFSIASKGYIGTGSGYSGSGYADFWEYDPSADTWTRKADFGAGERTQAAGFAIGNKGYMSTGKGVTSTYLWEYTPPDISIGNLPSTVLAASSSFGIPYNVVTLSFNPDNVFTVYLSDASGSFENETAIGSLAGSAVSGSIPAMIPGDIADGTTYRVRIKSSSPSHRGFDNGTNLVIKRFPPVGGSPGTSTLFLKAGWNFISLTIQPVDTSIGAVLKDISPNVRIVWGYDNQAKEWKKYRGQNSPETDNSKLETLEFGKGYWLSMDIPANLTVIGTDASPDINLSAGWNLIGYNGTNGKAAAEGLSSLTGRWSLLWNWTDDQWYGRHSAIPALPAPIQPLTSLYRGKAYWIRMANEGMWKQ